MFDGLGSGHTKLVNIPRLGKTGRKQVRILCNVVWAGPVAALSPRPRSALNRPKGAPVDITGMEQVLAYCGAAKSPSYLTPGVRQCLCDRTCSGGERSEYSKVLAGPGATGGEYSRCLLVRVHNVMNIRTCWWPGRHKWGILEYHLLKAGPLQSKLDYTIIVDFRAPGSLLLKAGRFLSRPPTSESFRLVSGHFSKVRASSEQARLRENRSVQTLGPVLS